ncbi:MAG: hypothetical protein ACREDM_03805 [Methylocella sp.]
MAIERPKLIETEKNKTCVANPTAAVSFGSPSRDTQSIDNRSTAKIAMSPTELAAVITMTWRMVEPSVKTPRGIVPEFAMGVSLLPDVLTAARLVKFSARSK